MKYDVGELLMLFLSDDIILAEQLCICLRCGHKSDIVLCQRCIVSSRLQGQGHAKVSISQLFSDALAPDLSCSVGRY